MSGLYSNPCIEPLLTAAGAGSAETGLPGTQKSPARSPLSPSMRLRGYGVWTFVTLLLSFALGWGIIAPSQAEAKVYNTKEEAIKNVFPAADTVEKKTVFLNDEEKKQAEELGRVKLDSKMFTFYIGKKGKDTIGYAVFESHIVRTKPEVFMLLINPNGEIERIEILAFYEPEEYLPPKRWLQLFKGKYLNDQLRVKRDIHAITGATLTAEGITREIRRILAVFELMVLKK